MTQWVDPQPVQIPAPLRQALASYPVPLSSTASDLIATLLIRLGIADAAAVCSFLDPSAYIPASPDELIDADVVAQRLQRAIADGERIAIWGDFDVDGQTATALYLQALRDLGANVTFHIPSRHESHGVHPVGVQRLIDEGTRLILTADTGVDAHPAAALAGSYGVEILITDHHDLPDTLPDTAALVNPKRLPGNHPLYELTGVGVAYQVIRLLYERALPSGARPTDHLLDLVALGIVADVATLRGDVRYLLQRGLNMLRATDRLGLKVMTMLAGLDLARVNEQDIGFAIAPRLNALSRVGKGLGAEAGVELLTTNDRIRARTIATELEALNTKRQWLVRETTDAALAQVEKDRTLLDGPAIVIAGANWEPGIVGIVAGRLAGRFNRPVIALSAPPGEIARGSARSIQGIDIHAAIAAHKAMLHRCGGHPMAAGLSLDSDRIPAFRRALWRTLEQAGVSAEEKQIHIDAYLSLDQISLDLIEAINHLAPFGPGNEQPIFATSHLVLTSSAAIGRGHDHRRVVVRDRTGTEQAIVWWQSADEPLPDSAFDLAYTLGINTFRGEANVQLTWVDARPVASAPVPIASGPSTAANIQVTDYRRHVDPESALRTAVSSTALVSTQAVDPNRRDILIWGEGATAPGIVCQNRSNLHQAPALIIWTAPPDSGTLQAALKTVEPHHVILFGVDPGMDTPRPFLSRLLGLIKHVINQQGGQTTLTALAAATAQTETAVRLGLEWMACRGQIGWTLENGAISLFPATGQDRSGDADPEQLQPLLQARLQETAAYRAYFLEADPHLLINP